MKILICDQPVINSANQVSCDAWQMTDYESLAKASDIDQLMSVFEFSPSLFGIIVSGLLLTFISGHVVGNIVRTMRRS